MAREQALNARKQRNAALVETMLLAAANRSFIRRAVRFLVGEAGIDQILDIGSGLPTAGNVHEVVGRGATRIVVVRAITDAGDPEAAARELRAALEGHVRAGR